MSWNTNNTVVKKNEICLRDKKTRIRVTENNLINEHFFLFIYFYFEFTLFLAR